MPVTHLEAYDKAKNYVGMARDTGRGEWSVICLVDHQVHRFPGIHETKTFLRQVGAAKVYEFDAAKL